jgi:hypothetical protein
VRRRRSLLIGLLLAVYVGSYLWLSRRGYEEAERFNMCGFYYFTPEPTPEWRFKNYGCVRLFAPLNVLDCALGTGRPPGCEPLWGLSL